MSMDFFFFLHQRIKCSFVVYRNFSCYFSLSYTLGKYIVWKLNSAFSLLTEIHGLHKAVAKSYYDDLKKTEPMFVIYPTDDLPSSFKLLVTVAMSTSCSKH